jgi:NADH:ubiquinone oxidoreductase subunit F (NADH-binding)
MTDDTCTPLAQAALAPDADALPRVLSAIPVTGAMRLEQHLDTHGPLPARSRGGRQELIEQLDASGLLGRGGGAFPFARKLRAVAGAGRRPVLVVNGAEGEPASLKDRMLLASLPHLALDGAQLAAQALRAGEVIVCVCESSHGAAKAAGAAIAERRDLGQGGIEMRVAKLPDHYLSGQESALVNHLNTGRLQPTFTPPLPFQRGVQRRPTLVSNCETLAHAALIARHGAGWFRRLGMPSQTGSALVTLWGPVAAPGVYEIEYGAALTSLIEAAGGATAGVRAALFGGYGGAWVDARMLPTLALSDEHLAPHGAAMGAGVVVLLSEQACPVAETVRVAAWLASQSSGQCGPCVHGLQSLAGALEELSRAQAGAEGARRLTALGSLVVGRGACRHPDGAVEFVLSALEVFAEEFSDHMRHGSCAACDGPFELPMPRALSAPDGPRALNVR